MRKNMANITQLAGILVINEFTSVQVTGAVSPFANSPRFDLTGRIENLALPYLSPYVEKYLGLPVEKGTATLAGTGRISEQGELDGQVNLDVRGLGFGAVPPERAKEFADRTGGLDPNTARNWLEDADGLIALSIPITGDIDEPQFDFDQLVARAVAGAVRSAVSTTLKIVFPPTMLVAALQDSRPGITLRPVLFDPLSDKVDADGMALLSSVARLLKQRPGLRVDVCGRSVKVDFDTFVAARIAELKQPPADARPNAATIPDAKSMAASLSRDPAILSRAREELSELAVRRTRAIRRSLSEDHAIDIGRTGACRASFEADDTGPPRAAIGF